MDDFVVGLEFRWNRGVDTVGKKPHIARGYEEQDECTSKVVADPHLHLGFNTSTFLLEVEDRSRVEV